MEDKFWEIVDQSRTDAPEAQIASLTATLEAQNPEDLLAFQTVYYALLDKAYRWDLWGAAFVISGGCSDDGFDYFCDWLISRGRTIYEAAIADPESLADTDLSGDREFEEFRYVADEVYQSKVGREMDLPLSSRGEPVGQPFDEGTIDDQYPRLAEAALTADMEDLGLLSHDPKTEKLIELGVPVFSDENMRKFDARLSSFIGQKISAAGAIHNHVCLNLTPGMDTIEARCWSIELADGRELHAAKYVIDFGDAIEGIPKNVLAYMQAQPRFHEAPQTQEEILEGLMKGIRAKPSIDEEVGQATDQALKSGSGQPIISSSERVGIGSIRLTFEDAPECRSLTLHGCDKNGSGDVHGVSLKSEGETLCLSRFGVELQLPNRLWGW